MKYVIIGNSTAAVGAVEGIRSVDTQGQITVISTESHHAYSRPLISYLLLGKTTEETILYRGDSFYTDNKVTLLLNTVATAIDAEEKKVVLSDGTEVPYDKLLVATGSSPFVPPFEGLDTVNEKFTFMSLDDARLLGAALDENKRVLIIGGGLIGLKCAEAVVKRVKQVTVVDLSPKILSSILDDDGARMVHTHLESCGIEFNLGCSVQRFEQNTAILDNGDTLDFDILVLAVGVRANTSLLSEIATVERGIQINEKSQTTAENIYAAGDCTQSFDVSSGDNKVMALFPNAYMQGECAGINMAGGEKVFETAIPMNAIGFFGLHVITAGNYNGMVYADSSEDTYKRLFYSDNALRGFILIGNVEKAGIYTNLIKERIPLDTLDFALICEKPGLMAFSKDDRKLMMEGGVK